MIKKFVRWQRKKYNPAKRAVLALGLSSVFIFLFIPGIPLVFFRQADRNFALSQILPAPVNLYLGLTLAVVGLVLFWWTVLLFLIVGRGTQVPLAPTQKLITSGPFAYSRNPMYLGVIIWVVGLGLLYNSFPFIILGFIIPGFYLIYVKLVEEKELAARFGKEYLEYKKKVPFLI